MTAMRAFFKRLRGMVRSGAGARELDAEIASHLAEATEEYLAQGLSRSEARLAAMRDFGGVTQTKQVHRELRSFTWPDDVRQDLKYTFRRLVKEKTFSVVAIATLALGIGANTTIFTLLDAVVFKPLPVPAPHELVTLHENGPEGAADSAGGTGRFFRFSYPRFDRLEQALGTDGLIAAVTRTSAFVVRLPGVTAPQFTGGQLVSSRYFDTLGVNAALGRTLNADDARPDQTSPAAVVSDGFWKRMFGGAPTVIGQTINLNGVTATIVGVMPPGFFGMWSDAEAQVWLPITLQYPLRYRNNTSSYGYTDDEQTWLSQDLIAWVNVVARIAPQRRAAAMSRLQLANAQGVGALAAELKGPDERKSMLAHTLVVEPFAHGFSGLRGRYSDALFALGGLVALVLLVTCANLANLLLAHGAGQARDLSIRLSLGASTGRLIQQRLIESLTLAIIGGAVGVGLGEWASAFLAREVLGSSGQLPTVFAPDSRVLIFAVAVSVITAGVFGLAPALRAIALGRKVALVTSQRQAVGHVTGGGMRSLVVGQLALSVVIVFAAMLLGRTLLNFMRIDPGFSTDHIVSVSMDSITSGIKPSEVPAFSERMLDAVRGLPGVRSASTSMCGLIAGCSSSSSYSIEGSTTQHTFMQNWISTNYFQTVGIPLIDGREFGPADADGGAAVAIVNESLARRHFPNINPLGHHLRYDKVDIEIVGLARDARTQSLHDSPEPMVYLPIAQWGGLNVRAGVTALDVRVAGEAASMIAAVRSAIKGREPNLLLFDVRTVSTKLSRDLNRERVVAYLAFSFAALTLLLASLGLYGVLSYGVAQRTQEIGVRMALGARRIEVMRSVLLQSARMTSMGMALGLVATTAAAGYLAKMLYGVAPLDPATYVVVLIVFALVTTVASYAPARRATKVDPITALRYD